MKNNYLFSDAWRRFPHGLAELIHFTYSALESKYVIPGVIKYVVDHMDDYGQMPDDVLVWIDTIFSDLLTPLELADGRWEDEDGIAALLSWAENTLSDIAPEALGEPITESDLKDLPSGKTSYIVLLQHLHTYQAVQSFYTGDGLFRARLERMLEDTKANITYLLTQSEDPEALYGKYLVEGLVYIQGMEPFEEPLSWAYHELGYDCSASFIADVFKEYIAFLSDFPCAEEKKPFLNKLLARAERRLQDICRRAVEVLDDNIQELNEDLEAAEDQNRELEKTIRESQRRYRALFPETTEIVNDDPDECPF
ncbi:MAG: hypothetical protein IJH45_01500 [Firmicutes bacterium]|nr:hypothetical protein [Bacillota bacterium]